MCEERGRESQGGYESSDMLTMTPVVGLQHIFNIQMSGSWTWLNFLCVKGTD